LSSEETHIFVEISRKLDSIITLLMLSNMDEFKKAKEELTKDKVAQSIISKANGAISYSDLSKEVAKELQAAEITVRRKISDLKSIGVIIGSRKGREVFYQVSPLFE